MRIALVTTWGTACGIATYSEELTRAYLKAGHDVTIFAPAEMGSCIRETGIQVPTVQCWTRQFAGLSQKMDFLLKQLPGFDVVHFQHEHGLFWSAPGLLEAMREISTNRDVYHGARVVVTLHTLYHYGSWQHSGLYDGLRHMADGIIVHTAEGAASITCARGTRAELVIVPHGTELGAKGDRIEGFNYLSIPKALWDKAVFGIVFGFQGPSKNTICTVRAFADSLSRRYQDNGVLIIAGEDGETGYFKEIENAVCESGYGRHVHIHRGFTPVARVPDVMAVADFGVLNTNSWTISASGAAHVYMRYGVPLAVANRPIYNEAIRAGAIPFTLETDAYLPTLSTVNAIGALVRDKGLRETVGQQLRAYAERSSWENVAKMHTDLYSRLKGAAS